MQCTCDTQGFCWACRERRRERIVPALVVPEPDDTIESDGDMDYGPPREREPYPG